MTSPVTYGLGRVFAGYDEQSRAYSVRTLLPHPVERVPKVWKMPIGPFPLDQGNEGACSGFGLAHELACGPVVVHGVNNGYARHLYRRNREFDRRMGNYFPSGATVLATMKAAKADKRITGYRWCFGVDDVLDTVCSVGPVCLGIEWRTPMYTTAPDGLVTVTGDTVGGHFIAGVGYDVHPEHGECVLVLNSWGRAWGVPDTRVHVTGGVGWLPVHSLDELLRANGEAVAPADWFAH